MNVWGKKQRSFFDLSLQPVVPSTFFFEVNLCLNTSLPPLVVIRGEIRSNKDKDICDHIFFLTNCKQTPQDLTSKAL